MKQHICCIFLLIATVGLSQEFNWKANLAGTGYIGSEDNLPFWMVANTNGGVSEETNGLFSGRFFGSYALSESASLEAGASFFLRDGFDDSFNRDELYITFKNSWIKATLGSERPTDRFNGLGTVQEDFLLSGNARALPGLLIESPTLLPLFKNIKISWGIAHYELDNNRFVQDAKLHYKHLGVYWKVAPRLVLMGGITHYAQWGGISPERGAQPEGFSDFIDVFLARRGGNNANDSDQANAAGNHLGIYEFQLIHDLSYGSYNFYHQHPFEDGSGTRLKNFPDGIWGFQYTANQENFTSVFKGFLIEFVQTTNQSGRFGDSGRDNYFRSGIYRSGWTYDQNILGWPFISADETGLEIGNSRVRAFHLGVMGGIKRWALTTKLTYSENQGTYSRPINPKQKLFYSFFKLDYSLNEYGTLSFLAGFDFGDALPDTYAGGLRYSYNF